VLQVGKSTPPAVSSVTSPSIGLWILGPWSAVGKDNFISWTQSHRLVAAIDTYGDEMIL
jgi:hypothetical protein